MADPLFTPPPRPPRTAHQNELETNAQRRRHDALRGIGQQELDGLLAVHDASGSGKLANALRWSAGRADAKDDVARDIESMARVRPSTLAQYDDYALPDDVLLTLQ